MSEERCDRTAEKGKYRCRLSSGHVGNHLGYPRPGENGPAYWPDAACDDRPPTDATLDELLAHLDDLIDHASYEGFALFAESLRKHADTVRLYRSLYEPSSSERSGARSALQS